MTGLAMVATAVFTEFVINLEKISLYAPIKIAFGLAMLDQIGKAIALLSYARYPHPVTTHIRNHFNMTETVVYLGEKLHYHHSGLLLYLIIPFSIAASLWFAHILSKIKSEVLQEGTAAYGAKIMLLAPGLILGAAFSVLIDVIFLGRPGALNYIEGLRDTRLYNLADLASVSGLILFVAGAVLNHFDSKRNQAKAKKNTDMVSSPVISRSAISSETNKPTSPMDTVMIISAVIGISAFATWSFGLVPDATLELRIMGIALKFYIILALVSLPYAIRNLMRFVNLIRSKQLKDVYIRAGHQFVYKILKKKGIHDKVHIYFDFDSDLANVSRRLWEGNWVRRALEDGLIDNAIQVYPEHALSRESCIETIGKGRFISASLDELSNMKELSGSKVSLSFCFDYFGHHQCVCTDSERVFTEYCPLKNEIKREADKIFAVLEKLKLDIEFTVFSLSPKWSCKENENSITGVLLKDIKAMQSSHSCSSPMGKDEANSSEELPLIAKFALKSLNGTLDKLTGILNGRRPANANSAGKLRLECDEVLATIQVNLFAAEVLYKRVQEFAAQVSKNKSNPYRKKIAEEIIAYLLNSLNPVSAENWLPEQWNRVLAAIVYCSEGMTDLKRFSKYLRVEEDLKTITKLIQKANSSQEIKFSVIKYPRVDLFRIIGKDNVSSSIGSSPVTESPKGLFFGTYAGCVLDKKNRIYLPANIKNVLDALDDYRVILMPDAETASIKVIPWQTWQEETDKLLKNKGILDNSAGQIYSKVFYAQINKSKNSRITLYQEIKALVPGFADIVPKETNFEIIGAGRYFVIRRQMPVESSSPVEEISAANAVKPLEQLTWQDPEVLVYYRTLPALLGAFTRLRNLSLSELRYYAEGRSPHGHLMSIVLPIFLFGENWRSQLALQKYGELTDSRFGALWFVQPGQLKGINEMVRQMLSKKAAIEPIVIYDYGSAGGEETYSIAVMLNKEFPDRNFVIKGLDVARQDAEELNYLLFEDMPAELEGSWQDYFDVVIPQTIKVRMFALKSKWRHLAELISGEAGDISRLSRQGEGIDIIVANGLLGAYVNRDNGLAGVIDSIIERLNSEGVLFVDNSHYRTNGTGKDAVRDFYDAI
ncbi:MAG: hypothetical protein PHF11_07445, partial [Candidatus Omnitrophica bacterium]|nr:hypothetical protein [Candidatus Omnitrophota bacterium]